jgi:hypothetical protein
MNRGKENRSRQPFERKAIFLMLLAFASLMCFCSPLLAQQPEASVPKQPSFLSVREFLAAGGAIGYVIMFLSFVMVAVMADAAISLRRTVFMPPGLAEEVHRLLAERKPQEARSLCMNHPGFLSQVLAAGLPIATGVIEGACRHLVKDRLERTGTRWSASGAQAMLSLRCLKASNVWDEFQQQFLSSTPLKA